MINIRNIKNKFNYKFSFSVVNNLLFILILVLSVFYVTTINDLAVKGYAMQVFQKDLKELKEEKNDLELRVAFLRSYNYLDDKINLSGYVASSNVEYIILSSQESDIVARK